MFRGRMGVLPAEMAEHMCGGELSDWQNDRAGGLGYGWACNGPGASVGVRAVSIGRINPNC